MRVATKDDEISAGKPFLDKTGEYRNSIKIKKHDTTTTPYPFRSFARRTYGGKTLIPSGTLPRVQFYAPWRRIEKRWRNLPEEVKVIQGLYSKVITFVSESRRFASFRFALAE
jgi:hypothetical protein